MQKDPSTCIFHKDKYLKSIVDTSVIACDKFISAMDILSTKMINTIAMNVSKNSDDIKVSYKIIIFCAQFYY